LDYFEAILCADDVRRVKPDPGLFLAALSALQLRAEEVIAFEDSPNGVKAAKSVSIFTVAVPNFLTRQLKVEGADILLNSLAGMTLADLLEQIGNELEIHFENPEDIPGIRAVNESAFGQVNEANLVDLIRSRGKACLSLVAVRNGRVLGHILFSPVTLGPRRSNPHGVGLAPVAVLPEYQNQGIGSRLICVGLQMCREAGWDFVIVVGHPAYYPRFGFIAGRCFGLSSSYGDSEAFMVMELKPGALKGAVGMVKYSPEFAKAGC
jgi:putative acetyltransferase